MKKKNGFVFIETIVVVAILTFSLILVYASYNSAVIKEKNRLRYNDTVFLYRSYYITSFIKKSGFKNLSSTLSGRKIALIGSTDLDVSDEEGTFYNNIVDNFHVKNIYLTINDLSYLWECNYEHAYDCDGVTSQELYNFLKTVGGLDTEGYRIVVEFAETPGGERCQPNKPCKYKYATFSVGELTGELT